VLNFSDADQKTQFKGSEFAGKYQELFTGRKIEFKADDKITLTPWQYLVYLSE
jgi:hypothetical protein